MVPHKFVNISLNIFLCIFSQVIEWSFPFGSLVTLIDVGPGYRRTNHPPPPSYYFTFI